MSTSTTEPNTDKRSAVHYDRDADGIVTLTLDDPTASANTMNELYLDRWPRPSSGCTTRPTTSRAS